MIIITIIIITFITVTVSMTIIIVIIVIIMWTTGDGNLSMKLRMYTKLMKFYKSASNTYIFFELNKIQNGIYNRNTLG